MTTIYLPRAAVAALESSKSGYVQTMAFRDPSADRVAFAPVAVAPVVQAEPFNSICRLIAEYYGIAWNEGREGRNHDTIDGKAADCLHRLQSALRAALAAPAPALAAPTDPQGAAALALLTRIRYHAQRHALPREWLTAADEVLGTWGDVKTTHPEVSADAMLNGLTEAETAQTASVAGLVGATTEPAPVNGIKATMFHDEGAIAQCHYCKRYSLDRNTLHRSDSMQPVCECGKQHGWCGSFAKPGPDAKWSGAAPAEPAPQPEAPAAVQPESATCGCTPWEQQHCAGARSPYAEHPHCERMKAPSAVQPVPAPADVLLSVIQTLNAVPYNLTKRECIAQVEAMRAAHLATGDAS